MTKEEAIKYLQQLYPNGGHCWLDERQQEQFEKNRLKACDSQTKEEAEREWNFVDKMINEEHRQPTYSDAIEYGMKLQKEQMMKDVDDAYCKVCGHFAHSVPTHICRHDCRYFSDFKNYIKGE